ncbi:MAG: hypothetical protein ACRCTI_19080 [Beijerinckiaceae bacterium]
MKPWNGEILAQKRLRDLQRLPENWGGSEKPSEHACRVALNLVRSMEKRSYRLPHIAPIADGGVALSYEDGSRAARFDVCNEGEVVVAMRENDRQFKYMELPEADAVTELIRFLENGDPR